MGTRQRERVEDLLACFLRLGTHGPVDDVFLPAGRRGLGGRIQDGAVGGTEDVGLAARAVAEGLDDHLLNHGVLRQVHQAAQERGQGDPGRFPMHFHSPREALGDLGQGIERLQRSAASHHGPWSKWEASWAERRVRQLDGPGVVEVRRAKHARGASQVGGHAPRLHLRNAQSAGADLLEQVLARDGELVIGPPLVLETDHDLPADLGAGLAQADHDAAGAFILSAEPVEVAVREQVPHEGQVVHGGR
mmetsp:Transcript_45176/g.131438  ORF Transcript_45176/g.131438 Transcript_45176/m.131438 type:complete len:248 (+) Transcript_45176:833-1576(+)